MINLKSGATIASAAAALAAAAAGAGPTPTSSLPGAKVSSMSAMSAPLPNTNLHTTGTAANGGAAASSSSSSVTAIKCQGINACKGKGSCASASNSCQGQNGCKGRGWVIVATADVCTAQKGTVIDDKPKGKLPA